MTHLWLLLVFAFWVVMERRRLHRKATVRRRIGRLGEATWIEGPYRKQ